MTQLVISKVPAPDHVVDAQYRQLSNEPETCASINTPRPLTDAEFSYNSGGVTMLGGPQNCGKSRVIIAKDLQLIGCGYDPRKLFANVWLGIPGAHWLRNAELRQLLRRAYNIESGQWQGCIFNIMETDGLYSHKTADDNECFQDLRDVSQSYHFNNHLFTENHEGPGVKKYIRDKTEIYIEVESDDVRDAVDLTIYNGHYPARYRAIFKQTIGHISAVHRLYRRRDPIY